MASLVPNTWRKTAAMPAQAAPVTAAARRHDHERDDGGGRTVEHPGGADGPDRPQQELALTADVEQPGPGRYRHRQGGQHQRRGPHQRLADGVGVAHRRVEHGSMASTGDTPRSATNRANSTNEPTRATSQRPMAVAAGSQAGPDGDPATPVAGGATGSPPAPCVVSVPAPGSGPGSGPVPAPESSVSVSTVVMAPPPPA